MNVIPEYELSDACKTILTGPKTITTMWFGKESGSVRRMKDFNETNVQHSTNHLPCLNVINFIGQIG